MSETGVHRWGSVTKWGLAVVAITVAGMMLSACSPGAEYPSLFPAIHDTPPPRAEAPLDSLEIQRATEDLISARDHLTAEAQTQAKANASTNAPPNSPAKSSTSMAASAANPPAKRPAAAQAQAVATDGSQPAAPETKP
jgi:hypothetical protein